MAKALIVVDVQNDFCEGGSLAVTGGSAVATKTGDLLRTNDYDLVVATLDYHKRLGDNGGHFGTDDHPADYNDRWPVHCVQGSGGAGFKAPLDPQRFAEIFTKGDGSAAYSGFEGIGQQTGQTLEDYLYDHEVTHVDIVGIAYDYCVKATALDASDIPFAVHVLKDLTASVNPDNDDSVTAELTASGISVHNLEAADA